MERTPSALTATTHDRPVSIVCVMLVRPSADVVIICKMSFA
jgi:hypothetical protein